MRGALVAGVVGGLVGGLLGAGVMSAGHGLATKIMGREPSPPASDADEDSTLKVAQEISKRARHRPLAPAEKPIAGNLVHYAFGASMGLVYGAAVTAMPLVAVGSGAGFGAAVWLGAHALVVPALGLAPSPLRQPIGKEALEFVLHIAYGLTVGLVHRAALRISR
jgi:putative membrane protein